MFDIRSILLLAAQLGALVELSPAAAQQNVEQVAARAIPAVVVIHAKKPQTATVGSGFIVNADGTLLTNHHVIAGATSVTVKLSNGDTYDHVRLLISDERRDVAILKIDGFGLPTLALGNSDSVSVGATMIAIGSPLGLENSVSTGVLSGIREVDGGKWLQISVPISPGSSGGPLLDLNGNVVAIASAGVREGQMLNFGVPINYARGLLGRARSTEGTPFSATLEPARALDRSTVNLTSIADTSVLSDYKTEHRVQYSNEVKAAERIEFVVVRGAATTSYELRFEDEARFGRGRGDLIGQGSSRSVFVGPSFLPIAIFDNRSWRDGSGNWQSSTAEFRFTDAHVTGSRSSTVDSVRRADQRLPNGITATPRTLFAWLPDDQVKIGLAVAISYFDPQSLSIREVQFRPIRNTRIRVPAGTFDVIEVDIVDGPSVEKVYVRSQRPRVMVKRESSGNVWELERLTITPRPK